MYLDNFDHVGIIPNDDFLLDNCDFQNCSALNDGGAIHFDLDSGADHNVQNLNFTQCVFADCEAKFGGALSVLGGVLNISNSNFVQNHANFDGGAIYTSHSNVYLAESFIYSNSALRNAGAIYFDNAKLTLNHVSVLYNTAANSSSNAANAIYANDAEINFSNSTFDNGGVSVYANFAKDSKLDNNNVNKDIFLLNNTDCTVSIETPGIKLNLIKNEIVVSKLPSKFDSRDFGWVSPIKTQGDNDDCWAFATAGSLESALLKSTGVLYNLSENYVQKLQLKYHPAGDARNVLTGFDYSGLGYALSWQGALNMDSPYDDRGMILDSDLSVPRIHLQDAMIIFAGHNNTVDSIKRAVMKYGSVTLHRFLMGVPNSTVTDKYIDNMEHDIHFVSVVGWDDALKDDDNLTGCWIVKDSLGSFHELAYADNSILATDYYAVVPQAAAIAYIFENDIDYHVNYQTDITGLTGFTGNYTVYSNEFNSKYSELIGAVGTYFNESGIDYSFDIYIDSNLVHSQSGVSEFAGFRTIILNKYIPVKAGDKFKVVFKNNALPYQAFSRMHYISGMTMVSADGKTFKDITLENKTVCLKVYTVKDDTKIIANNDISVDYSGGKYFSVKVVTSDGRQVGAGATVKFTIGGKTYNAVTDSNGIAKVKITQTPKKYTVTTSYNGKTYKNTVTVKQVLTASKVTVKKSAKKLTLNAKLKINDKLVKGKVVKFKFKGKTYKVKTGENGVAKKVLGKKIIKKLKKGKTYNVKITYLKTTIKTTVKVKR
ncbi:lectin like domain-containing protein [Methanobrevibacter sp.]|uniref:lectin like domain-containing protein n=1 Tax=Methanobrevibacter sp. TaxID=66852 RepID=UPI0038902216